MMTETFYSVYGWMPKELHIGGGDLHVFALIYSFTENCGRFEGGLQYLAEETGSTKGTVFRTLKRLLDKKLIVKQEVCKDGKRYCLYAACDRNGSLSNRLRPVGETPTQPLSDRLHPVGETPTQPLSKRQYPVGETTTNNKTHNKTHNKVDKISSAPVKNRYGEYHNVLLTQEELEKLRAEFPEDWQRRIERLSAYMASTGKGYKNHLATIRNWAMRDEKEKPKQEESPFAFLKGGLSL